MECIHKRDLSIDLLRIYSCVCIILLHEAGYLIFGSRFSLTIQVIVRPCLWVFAMLSGYFVLSAQVKSFKAFYLRKIPKIIIPLFVYCFIYQLVINFNNINSVSDAIKIISLKSILAGDIYGHFWFVYALIGAYLLVPVIQLAFERMTDKQLTAFMLICFFFSGVTPVLEALGFKVGFEFPLGGVLLFFFFLGYYVKRVNIERFRIPILIIGLINLPIIYFSFSVPVLAGSLCNGSIQMVIGVLFYYILFTWRPVRLPQYLENCVSFLSKKTYGIYLAHLLVLHKLAEKIPITLENKFSQVFINVLIIFAISFLLSIVIDFFLVKPIMYVYMKFISLSEKKLDIL